MIQATFPADTTTQKLKKLKTCIALHGISELRSVTCHMATHRVTCHPTQVSAPHLNPSHAGWYSIYLPRRDGRLSLPCYSETQPPGVELATSRSRIQRHNHWATKQHTMYRMAVSCVCWKLDRVTKRLRDLPPRWHNASHWAIPRPLPLSAWRTFWMAP